MVDAGDFAWKSSTLGLERRAQQRAKADVFLASWAMVGFDGGVPGDGDLALGVPWLVEASARHDIALLAANLECDGAAPFSAARIVERDGLTVALVGVLGEHLRVPAGCTVLPPGPAVLAALDALGPADLTVALTHQEPAADEELARTVPRIDLVVAGGTGATHPDPRPLPEGAVKLAAGSRGKKLGIAQIELRPGASGFRGEADLAQLRSKLERSRKRLETARAQIVDAEEGRKRERTERRIKYYEEEISGLQAELEDAAKAADVPSHGLRNELFGLTADVPDHPATAALLEARRPEIEAAVAAPQDAPGDAPPSPYVGFAACTACHAPAAAQWASTGHAHAWNSLAQAGRQMDLDCFRCHVTGAHDPDGPQHPASVAGLENVGCESCHGPGRAHIANPTAGKMVRSPPVETCQQCHDGTNDEGRFEPERYMSRVAHGGQ